MTNALDLQAPVETLAMEFTREFDAPVSALFRTHAEPDLVKQWLGPHGVEMRIEEWQFATHGCYRYVHSTGGGDFRFNGTFHTVRENELIIQTFEFNGAPDMVNIEFLWFEDLGDGRSRLRGRSICPNTEARRCAAVLGHGGRHDGGLREARRAVESRVIAKHEGARRPGVCRRALHRKRAVSAGGRSACGRP